MSHVECWSYPNIWCTCDGLDTDVTRDYRWIHDLQCSYWYHKTLSIVVFLVNRSAISTSNYNPLLWNYYQLSILIIKKFAPSHWRYYPFKPLQIAKRWFTSKQHLVLSNWSAFNKLLVFILGLTVASAYHSDLIRIELIRRACFFAQRNWTC